MIFTLILGTLTLTVAISFASVKQGLGIKNGNLVGGLHP